VDAALEIAKAARNLYPKALTPRELGAVAVHLSMTFPLWVRRRKVAFQLLDETSVLQRQSVDFQLSDDHFPTAAVPRQGARIYVPLNIAPKGTLTSFSVFDEDGRALSLANTAEHAQLATDGLSAVFDGFDADSPTGAYKEILRSIVAATDAKTGAECLGNALQAGLEAVLPEVSPARPLLFDLAGGFLMLVPVSYEQGVHRVVKFQEVTAFTLSQGGIGGLVREPLSSLGLASRILRFADLPIGWAQGTHFEFTEPTDVRLVKGILSVAQHDPKLGDVTIPKRRVVYGKPRLDLNVSVRDQASPQNAREDSATVSLSIRPQAGGAFTAVTVASVACWLLLAELSKRLALLDSQTSAAVLLVLPALLVAYLVRPGEHAIATRSLAGVRLLGLICAAAAVAGAAMIGASEVRRPQPTGADRIDCTPVSATQGRGPAKRSVLRDVDCTVAPGVPPDPVASVAVADRLSSLAKVAKSASLVLVLGLLITAATAFVARRRDDESNADPPTKGLD
jgi:hypothetical protein